MNNKGKSNFEFNFVIGDEVVFESNQGDIKQGEIGCISIEGYSVYFMIFTEDEDLPFIVESWMIQARVKKGQKEEKHGE